MKEVFGDIWIRVDLLSELWHVYDKEGTAWIEFQARMPDKLRPVRAREVYK